MKKFILFIFIGLGITFGSEAVNYSVTTGTQTEIKKGKLTAEQRTNLIAKELKLNAAERAQVLVILKKTQADKEKIKALKISDKKKEEKIDAIKDIQKDKLKKLFGKERYKKYKQLKEDDVF